MQKESLRDRFIFNAKNDNVGLLIILILLTGIGVYRIMVQGINWDIAYLLFITEKWVGGAKLYSTIIDINPPFIYLYNLPAVLSSTILNIPAIFTFKIWLIITVLTSTGFSAWILNKSALRPHGLLLTISCWMIFQFTVDFTDIGQRDQIITLLIWPYVCFTYVNIVQKKQSNTNLQILAGFLAGFGILIKPYYLLLALCTELYFFFRSNHQLRLRPELVGLILAGLLAVIGIFLIFPEYLNTVLPLAKTYAQSGHGYNRNIVDLLLNPFHFILLLNAFLVFFLKHDKTTKEFLYILLVFSTVSWVVFIAQMKGWAYHLFPFRFSIVISFVTILASSSLLIKKPLLAKTASLILFRIFPVILTLTVLSYPILRYSESTGYTVFCDTLKLHAENKTIAVLTTEIYPIFPCVNEIKTDFVVPYTNLWPLPGIYRIKDAIQYTSPQNMQILEKSFYDGFVTSFVENNPQVVIVRVGSNKHGLDPNSTFDFIEYFSQEARFKEVWNNYVLTAKAGSYEIYKN